MRNSSWADLTEDEFGEQWIHGTSAKRKSRTNICAGLADGVKHKVKEHSECEEKIGDCKGHAAGGGTEPTDTEISTTKWVE